MIRPLILVTGRRGLNLANLIRQVAKDWLAVIDAESPRTLIEELRNAVLR